MLARIEVIRFRSFKDRIRIAREAELKYKGCKIKIYNGYIVVERWEEDV